MCTAPHMRAHEVGSGESVVVAPNTAWKTAWPWFAIGAATIFFVLVGGSAIGEGRPLTGLFVMTLAGLLFQIFRLAPSAFLMSFKPMPKDSGLNGVCWSEGMPWWFLSSF